MYAIRCKVKHSYQTQVLSGLMESHYIIIVDTPKLNTAFSVARRAMDDKYHQRYDRENFEFSAGAQKIDGSLDGQLYKILFAD